MILNTLKRYDHTVQVVEMVYTAGGAGQGTVTTRVNREVINCNVRLLNKLGFAEIRTKELLNYSIGLLAFHTIKSRSGQLVFPLSGESVEGRMFGTVTVTPAMDPFGDVFEWVYTVKHD